MLPPSVHGTYLVVMPSATARVSTLAEAERAIDGRGAIIFEACEDCGQWRPVSIALDTGDAREVRHDA